MRCRSQDSLGRLLVAYTWSVNRPTDAGACEMRKRNATTELARQGSASTAPTHDLENLQFEMGQCTTTLA